MEVIHFSKMSVTTYQTARCHNSEDLNINPPCGEIISCHTPSVFVRRGHLCGCCCRISLATRCRKSRMALHKLTSCGEYTIAVLVAKRQVSYINLPDFIVPAGFTLFALCVVGCKTEKFSIITLSRYIDKVCL